jgi:hypothetical protein
MFNIKIHLLPPWHLSGNKIQPQIWTTKKELSARPNKLTTICTKVDSTWALSIMHFLVATYPGLWLAFGTYVADEETGPISLREWLQAYWPPAGTTTSCLRTYTCQTRTGLLRKTTKATKAAWYGTHEMGLTSAMTDILSLDRSASPGGAGHLVLS